MNTPKFQHQLKCLPEFFVLIYVGAKAFEIRKHDREFRPGDNLELKEWSEETGYTGRWCICRVHFVLEGIEAVKYGVQAGYCIMSIEKLTGCGGVRETYKPIK